MKALDKIASNLVGYCEQYADSVAIRICSKVMDTKYPKGDPCYKDSDESEAAVLNVLSPLVTEEIQFFLSNTQQMYWLAIGSESYIEAVRAVSKDANSWALDGNLDTDSLVYGICYFAMLDRVNEMLFDYIGTSPASRKRINLSKIDALGEKIQNVSDKFSTSYFDLCDSWMSASQVKKIQKKQREEARTSRVSEMTREESSAFLSSDAVLEYSVRAAKDMLESASVHVCLAVLYTSQNSDEYMNEGIGTFSDIGQSPNTIIKTLATYTVAADIRDQ